MKYEITVSREVAAIGDGTRRRSVTLGKKRKLLTFSSRPTLLDELPPEVAADPHLVARALPAPKAAKKAGDGSADTKAGDGAEESKD